MTLEIEKHLDETGWQILKELQQNARLSYSELGQRVGLSSPAVADRVRKMEEAGILAGYHARVNLARLGLPVMAIVRLGTVAGQNCSSIVGQVSKIPEVLECYRVTGSDAVIIKVVATSVVHLEKIIDHLSLYGPATTSLVLSGSLDRRTITRELVALGELGELDKDIFIEEVLPQH